MVLLSNGRFLLALLLWLLLTSVLSSSKTKLHLLSLTPFHSAELSQFGWDGGPALVPAVRLATEHINSNDNILPDHELVIVEESISCHDESEREGRLLGVYANQVLYGEQSVLGIVGPACSVNALDLGRLSLPSRNPLVQVTIGTSPQLVNRTKFPYTFSTLSSGIRFLWAMKRLAMQEGWKKIGVILDVVSTYYLTIYEYVPSVFTGIDIETFNFEDGNSEFMFDFDFIVKSRVRIFIVLLSRNTADNFMCEAYRYGNTSQLIFDQVQWFFIERSTLLNPNTNSNCAPNELEKAFEKTVFLQYQLATNVYKRLNIFGQVYESFNQSYSSQVYDYQNKTGLSVFETYTHGLPYAPVFYDATWAFAMALDRVVRIRNGTLDLTAFQGLRGNKSKVLAEKLQKAIFDLDEFEGASGPIKFNKSTGQTNTIITFTQVINGTLQLIGTSVDDLVNGTFTNDSFPKEHVRIENWAASLVLLLVGILFLLTFLLHVLNMCYAKLPAIKATSPRLNHIIFIGCYLLILGLILYTVTELVDVSSEDNIGGTITCVILVWLTEIGIALIVATVLMKTFRIYRIFIHFTKPGGFFLQDSMMAVSILVLVLPTAIMLIATTITSGVFPSLHVENILKIDNYLENQTDYTRSMCVSPTWHGIVQNLYLGFLLIASLTLSLPLRHINPQFKTVKSISILTFCQILLTWIGYPLVLIGSMQGRYWDPHVRYFALVFILTGFLLSCLLLLFTPPVVRVLREKWNTIVDTN